MRPGMQLILLSVLFLTSCGYHLPGRSDNLPEDVHSVFIEIFANQTTKPFLENRMTNAMTTRFARNRDLRIESKRGVADAILSGRITGYGSMAISYDSHDVITEYQSIMTVTARLSRADTGKTIWMGDVSWRESYPANINLTIQEDSEKIAIIEISQRLADEIFSRITEDF
jgi:outer membrane lipopolysaccharide assembly protein LptE/RlpB